MVTVHVAAVQVCPELLPYIMNNWQFPFLLYASRIFPDKKMESTVERKLSHSCGLMAEFFVCGESCIGNMTRNVYVKGS
jgi:hypothetical protein